MESRSVIVYIVLALTLLAACTGTPAASGTPHTEVERGEALYDRHCLVCHGDPVTGEGRTELASIHGPDGHTWHHADQVLIDIVLGDFTYPTRTMPSFGGKLTEIDVRAILTYIKTGWTDDIREYQADVTRRTDEQLQ